MTDVESHPDGTFSLVAVGMERISLEHLDVSGVYPVGHVEEAPEAPSQVPDEVVERAVATFTAYRVVLSDYRDDPYPYPLPKDPAYLSWTLAAFGEELAYRGFLLTRLRQVLPAGAVGTVLAAVAAAVLFGWAHNEYGVVGVIQVTLDALFFTVLRFRYRTLWAGVVAHGVVNTIGIVAVFLVGPVAALW